MSAELQRDRGEVWTIGRILRWTQGYFAERKIDTPRLDAEVLLTHTLGCDRVYLYTHYDQPLSVDERQGFRALVQRRARYEPVAYICGAREFFGRDFEVDKRVLVPRPETEHVVELALEHVRDAAIEAPSILDIGTGSGVLAITLAAEIEGAGVWATDASAAALEVARANARKHAVAPRITFAQGDLFAPEATAAGRPFDIIVSNPPYVETAARDTLAPDVRDYEPDCALFAGADGLEIIRRLVADVRDYLRPGGLFLCEMGAEHAEAVQALLSQHGPWQRLRAYPDLQGHLRVMLAQAPVAS